MKTKLIDYLLIIILVLSIIFWLYRFYPYIFSDVPLWYDPGLYRHMFMDYFNSLPYVDFDSFTLRTRQAYPPFLGLLWNVFLLIWYDVDFLVTFMLAFFSVITSIYIYLYLKKYSKIIAIYWMILFFISIIQYESFFLNYYKQIIWIIFLLVSLYLLEKKKFILSIPIIITLFTINRPWWLFFVIMIIFYKLLNLKSPNKIIYTILFSWVISLLMYLPLFNEMILWLIKPLTTTFLVTWNSGTFFSLDNFIYYDYPIILLSFYWLYLKISRKDFDFTTIWYITWFLWVWLRLFFYSRFLIFFDIFIILIAAYWLWELYNKKKIYSLIFILLFSIQSYNYINYLNTYGKPFIPKSEFDIMYKLDSILSKDSLLMTTHKHYSSWLFWYTNKPIIAPWFFEYDLWERSDWDKWWEGNWVVKCEMINDYNIYKKDLYIWIWVDQDEEDLSWGDCFKVIYENEDNKILKVNFNQNEK